MLHAALLLPDLPLEVYARAASDDATRPFAVASGGSRPWIVVPDAAARAAGVRRGQPVAGALALVPDLVLRDRDPAAEAQALEAIATWALSFTPAVSLAPPRAVLAEIAGSRKLFGGLAAIVDALASGLAARGHVARIAIAPAPLAALVLARLRRDEPVLETCALAPALADLPLTALDLDARLLETLAAAGVRTIGAADALPRNGLARRFGAALVDALDRAHGRVPDPRPPWTPPPVFCGRLALPAPAHDATALGFAARRLAQQLAAWLHARGLGVLRFELALAHERWQHARIGRPATTIMLSFAAPARAIDHLATVLVERLARIALPAPVEGLVLTTCETAPLAGRLLSLLPGDEGDAPAVPLVDRLRARLGDDAVVSYATHDEHRPERALSALPHGTRADAGAAASLPDAPRPLWILSEPAPIGAAIAQAPWVLHDGPERIESGWWDGHDVRRDYYVAETPRGERAWIYRDHRRGTDDGEWWLHGWFA